MEDKHMSKLKHDDKSLPGWDMMAVILVLWLCSLPFIGLIIAPFFGIQAAALAALLLLIALMLYCWGRCLPLLLRFIQQYGDKSLNEFSDETNEALLTAKIRIRKYQDETH
jgi:hypothetical protein